MARFAGVVVAFVVLCLGPAQVPAKAQTYPSKPIHVLVPYAPGGIADIAARIVGAKLTEAWGQQVVVENKPGGNGFIAMTAAAKAAPDGYTLVMSHTGTVAINPTLYANPGYDPRKDFTPVGLISTTPIVLMAHPSFPAQTIGDLIALARKEPGKLNLGTPPPGTGGYLAAELFKAAAGVDVTIVPYKGTAALTNDLLGNQVPAGFDESVLQNAIAQR